MSSFGTGMPTLARSILSASRLPLREKSFAPTLIALQQVRGLKNQKKDKGKGKTQSKAKSRGPQEFRQGDLKQLTQYTLCDAMR